MNQNRTCKEICKKFKVTKPTDGGRYAQGQGHCQICDMWIDYRGAHTKDGTPATPDTFGWFCNCCNYRVRRTPRNKKYKEKLRAKTQSKDKTQSNSIPPFDSLTLPILQICNESSHTMQELENILAEKIKLDSNDRKLIMKNNETIFENRIYWAILYLKKANLIVKQEKTFSITDNGKKVLNQNPVKLDSKFLLPIPEFAEFYNKHKLVKKSLQMIKDATYGIYQSDMKKQLDISDEKLQSLISKLTQNNKIIHSEIKHDGIVLDHLLQYSKP